MTRFRVPRTSPLNRGPVLLLIVCAMLFISSTFAADPRFPALSGRIVDEANLLSAETERRLSSLAQEQEAKHSHQFVVVTVNSLQGQTIEDYGYQLGRHWGIGQEGRNNGALLIVAPNERKVRIEVGYGLEGALTDALSKRIIESIILPRFKDNDMSGGIEQGAKAILRVLDGEKLSPPIKEGQIDFGFVIALLFLAGAVGMVLYARFRIRNRAEYNWEPDLGPHYHGGFGGSGSGGFGGGGFGGGGGGFGGGGASGGW